MSWDNEAYGPHGRNHGQADLEAVTKSASGGLFEGNVFQGRRGMDGLGALPPGADTIASTLSRWRGQFPTIPPDAELSSKGATHYTTRVVGAGLQDFTFYTASGQVAVGPLRIPHLRMAEMIGSPRPVAPDTSEVDPVSVRSEGDGLLPSSDAPSSSGPTWLPWALIGGGVLVAGGIVWVATRKPARVTANKRRRRRRRRRTTR